MSDDNRVIRGAPVAALDAWAIHRVDRPALFTVPKMLRVYFLHHRELLGALSLAAYQTVKELMAAAVEEKGFRPGMVSVVQTFGDRANFHPHVHALVSRLRFTPGSPEVVYARKNGHDEPAQAEGERTDAGPNTPKQTSAGGCSDPGRPGRPGRLTGCATAPTAVPSTHLLG